MLPKEPVILLSYVNTKLRDAYPSLDSLCRSLDIDRASLTETLRAINYTYDASHNQFV